MIRCSLIAICLCVPASTQAKHEMTYRIEHSYGDVVAAVERLANEPRKRPFKVPNLPAMIEGKDAIVTTWVQPSQRYYRVNIRLERPIGRLLRFDKQLEVFGKPDHYVLKSTVDIDWQGFDRCRLLARIKARVLAKAECMVLQMERDKVMDYARRIGTPEVEQEDSMSSIFVAAWELVLRVVALRKGE